MSEIHQLFEIETYNYPDEEEEEIKNFLGTWEKIDDSIREVRWDHKSYKISEGEDICEAIIKSGKYKYLFDEPGEYVKVKLLAVQTKQKRGVYYPRIYRPICQGHDSSGISSFRIGSDNSNKTTDFVPYNEDSLIKSLEQFSTLIDNISRIFKTVSPSSENFKSFGFDIRNLIILSCTEFETQIVGILKKNNIKPLNNYYCTKDYVKLRSILRLSEYEIKFNFYPELHYISPFKDWKEEKPTKSIEWYDNYNAIKHDRETNFNKSRLLDLINSITACYILIIAQYGEQPVINSMLRNYLSIEKSPKWKHEDKYIKPFKDQEWIMNKYDG